MKLFTRLVYFLSHAPIAKLTSACLSFSVTFSVLEAIPPSFAHDYRLFFEDEFDGTSLDPANWFINEGPRKGAINVADSIEVSDGLLKIRTYTAENQAGNLNDIHHTGFISSTERFLHPFGYFEARIRFDEVKMGAWHAYWLMPGSAPPNWGSNPDSESGAEVDIFEYRYGNIWNPDLRDAIHHGLIWNGYGAGKQKAENPLRYPLDGASLLDGQFHTYGVLRTPEKYEFYFDGIKLWETTEGVSYAYSSLLLTSEVSDPNIFNHAQFAGHAEDEGFGPKGAPTNPLFTVDWVRVWHLDEETSGQEAYAANSIPGTIEAENFDSGGNGVSYYDKSDSGPGNATSYRASETVDLNSDPSASNGFYITEPTQNEWIEYTLDPGPEGIYNVEVDVARLQDTADNSDNGVMGFYVDSQSLGQIRTDDTEGWNNWHRQSLPHFAFLDGSPIFTVQFMNRRQINFDQLHFEYLGNVVDAREAESGEIDGLTIINTDLASGGAYLSGFGTVGSVEEVQFENVEGFVDGGEVVMTLRYSWPQANPNKSTGIKVQVNSEYLEQEGTDLILPLTGTRSWNMYNNLSVTLPGMLAGPTNTVVLESDGVSNQSIRLDVILFTGEEVPSGGGQILTLEAEDPANLLLGNPGNEAYVAFHANAQNGAYVNGLNKSNAGVEWPDLNLPTAGTALITIHYSNGSDSTSKTLEVNGTAQDLIFPPTSDWKDFSGTVQATVQLNGDGSDDVRLWRKHNNAGDSGGLRVDYIDIETAVPTATINHFEEAEGNQFGQAIIGTHASASGGAYADRLNKSASGIEWTTLSAPSDMQATLRFSYANGSGSDSLKMLVINGQSELVTFPATAGWNDFTGILELTVDLVEGDNTIRLWRDGAGIDALRIDYMELYN